MCGKLRSSGSLKDIISGEDGLCEECRTQWQKKNIHFYLEKTKVEATYVYNDAFSSCLIQYKECLDEALKDVFLYEVKNKIRWKYRGYTIVLMPSTKEKIELRGFHHLYSMFQSCGLRIMDPFIKNTNTIQKTLTYARRKEVTHQIVLKEGIVLPKKLLLVDDTITTGSTLKGALRCIDPLKHKVKIYCVSANQSWCMK